MSGDAQPRKRKNKGKKKGDQVEPKAEFIKERSGFRKSGLSEDSGDEEVFTPLRKDSTEEVIHVHKDDGCGGNIVTKLIFFGLLASIGVMVGVILLEYRGSSEEDTNLAVDSPWSVTLDSWVDKEAEGHHDEHLVADDEHEEHEHDEHEEHEHEEEGGGHDEHGDGHAEEEGSSMLSWFGFGGGESTAEEEEPSEGAGEDGGELLSEYPGSAEQKVEVQEELVTQAPYSQPSSPPAPVYQPPPPAPKPVTPAPSEPEEESPVEEEDETGEEEEEESEVEIDKDKFKELIAKYGKDTPESSDIEQSDDDIQKVGYSEGEESAGDEAEDSPAEVVTEDEQAPSEDELKDWTGIKKSDIEKITKLDTESEDEEEEESEAEEEEESEDEPEPTPPPPPQPAPRQRGGPREFQEEIYPNDAITNEEDWAIREELDQADEEFNYEEFYF